jgi:hypothetical protein
MDLSGALAEVLPVEVDDDGSVTVAHEGTVASLRSVSLAEDLELVSLTQMLAWDLPLSADLRKKVAAQANTTMLGTVTLSEQPDRRADVMLRYNFPAGGLTDSALRTLVLMVLDSGAEARRVITG